MKGQIGQMEIEGTPQEFYALISTAYKAEKPPRPPAPKHKIKPSRESNFTPAEDEAIRNAERTPSGKITHKAMRRLTRAFGRNSQSISNRKYILTKME